MERKSIPELLAPAGSMEALRAAVNAGADAVYLSGKSFGARYFAENFDELQMKEAVDYAHLQDLKVYVTVNTLVKEFELEIVSEYLLWLYQIGADAVILQDVGVASLCREIIPDLDMHASTQMNINNTEGVEWAYEFGFKRVVLARELNLAEIEEIVQIMGKKIELEIFAHGALCYCYSGQCLLSSVIGGRSGNRGQCAQPCRKPYQLLQGKKDQYGKLTNPSTIPTNKYLISTHDLALYCKLKDVAELALDSLKIEGRMRSAEYVATVVSIYRKALNDLKQGIWVLDEKDIFKLKLAFNRGFTDGHIFEDSKESLMGREASGNRGLYLGTVLSPENRNKIGKLDRNNKRTKYGGRNFSAMIGLDSRLADFYSYFKLEKGDGIVFIHPSSKSRYGLVIEEEPEYLRKTQKLLLKTKKQVPTGSKVYLTRDISFIKEIKDMMNISAKEFSIPIDIRIRWDKMNKAILEGKFTGKNGKEYDFCFKSDYSMEKAISSPLSKEQIVNQLKKTGGTPFSIRNLYINYPGNLFAPLSKLNEIRRKFMKIAEYELLKDYKPSRKSVEFANERWEKIRRYNRSKPYPVENPENMVINRPKNTQKTLINIESPTHIAVYSSSLETVSGALKGGCKRIYFEPILGEYNNQKFPANANARGKYALQIKELLLDAQELCIANEAELVWKWPNITRNNLIKEFLPLIKPLYIQGIDEVMIENLGAIRALNNLDIPIRLSGAAGLNIWNHRSIYEFSSSLCNLTLSNELSGEELSSIITNYLDNRNTSFELLVQGNLESMISEDCLLNGVKKRDQNQKNRFWGIKDLKNHIFPFIIDDEGRTHIFNSVELCLIDYLPDLCQMGFQHLIIDTRNKTSGYAQSMVSLYCEGLNLLEKSRYNTRKVYKLKDEIKKISQGSITTGSFIKGC